MSKGAASLGNDVRFLCEHPAFIKPALEKPASPHPLGLGIKNNYILKVGQDTVRLPKSSEGLSDLRQVTAQSIESLDEVYREQAWRSLLVQPKLLARLDDPFAAALHFGVSLSVGRGQTLQALAVGAVVYPPRSVLTDHGLVREEPVAGVGCLFVLVDTRRITHRAWLRARWTTTTRSLCRELEALHSELGLQFRGRRRRALLLASTKRPRTFDDQLMACAAVLGFDLRIVRSDGGLSAPLVTEIRQQPPAVTMVERSTRGSPEVAEAVQALGKELHDLQDDSEVLLLEEMRERLTKAAYLTPALTCRPLPRTDVPDDYEILRKAALPIEKKGQRLKHRATGFVYEEDVVTERYLTRDRSKHSQDREDNPVEYKRYRATARALVWEADLDKNAQEIKVKHKSEKFKVIPWSDLDPC